MGVGDGRGRRGVSLAGRLATLEARPLKDGLTLLVASDRRARRRGLAGLDADALPGGHGLLFERCRSVHTIGMRFALDLLWLDGEGAVVRVDRAVPPRRVRTCWGARSVVEVGAGDGERFVAAFASMQPGGV
jgi:uncharacterized membrane protein (UPF0127 family)